MLLADSLCCGYWILTQSLVLSRKTRPWFPSPKKLTLLLYKRPQMGERSLIKKKVQRFKLNKLSIEKHQKFLKIQELGRKGVERGERLLSNAICGGCKKTCNRSVSRILHNKETAALKSARKAGTHLQQFSPPYLRPMSQFLWEEHEQHNMQRRWVLTGEFTWRQAEQKATV